jgi:hypothetical protein
MTRIAPGLLAFGRRQRSTVMPKSKTHFEQVPVEVVKKIAEIELSPEAAETLKRPPKKK